MKISFNLISLIIGTCLITNLFLANPTTAGIQDAFSNNTLGSAGVNAGYTPDDNNPLSMVSIIITILLSLVGVIFLVLMIYGGINWMTAGGNEAQVKAAQNILSKAVIGLVIVLSAYAITYFIIDKIPK
jgi:hypothetical protein